MNSPESSTIAQHTASQSSEEEFGPSMFLHPELSLLAFHERVLHMALREDVPLLERLKFLCIFSSNLDEFFEIRVSGLKAKAASS